MKRTAVVTLSILLVGSPLSTTTSAQVPSAAALAIEKLMSASEFKQAGLDKLSPEQLAALNLWPLAGEVHERSNGSDRTEFSHQSR